MNHGGKTAWQIRCRDCARLVITESFEDMTIEFQRMIELGKVRFKIAGDVLFSEVNPFVTVGPDQVDALADIAQTYMRDRFGFISCRNQASGISINPSVWEHVFEKVPTIKSFALVAGSPTSVENFYIFEKPFIEEFGPRGFPAEAFDSKEQAYQWTLQQLGCGGEKSDPSNRIAL